MRGVVFTGDRKLEIRSFPDPTPGPGEAVIRMKASGMCGSDLHFYRAPDPKALLAGMGFTGLDRPGSAASTGVIAGHEPCGVVEALGPGAAGGFRVGDRVMVFHYEGCGTCDQCRTGWTQLCDEGAAPHGAVLHGGHAEYMKVPVTTLVHLPEEISFEGGAAIACGTGTAWGALLRLELTARDTLAVFGLGPVGLAAVQLGAAMGAEVIGVDLDPARVAAAKRFGAAHAVNGAETDAVAEIRALTGGKGASCAMDCAGGTAPKTQAVRATALWGRIALVAVGGELNIIGWNDLIKAQRTVVGSYTFSQSAMAECARFIAARGVQADAIFTDRPRLEDAAAAYRDFDRQSGGKGVFVFD